MKKKNFTRFTALCISTLLFGGCGAQTNDIGQDVKEGETRLISYEASTAYEAITLTKPSPTDTASVTDFGVRLFQQSHQTGENTLISPLSVIYAISMTANGSDGNTLTQMEQTIGIPVATLNDYLHNYIRQLPNDENNKLRMANSIWFRDLEGFTVNPDFLQMNADYYNAEIYQAPFSNKTVAEINQWVKQNTDEMIPEIIDKIPEETVMYLINALAFDAKWQKTYDADQVDEGIFTKEDGTTRDIELMYSTEHQYLEDENAVGFIKYYKDCKYAFAALLPNEDVAVSDYISSLNGTKLQDLLSNPRDVQVNTAIPKFELEYDLDMTQVLKNMGMTDAFEFGAADFSKLGHYDSGNIAINRILHKTFIAVDEIGTKAGAITMVEMNVESAMMEPEEIKTVYLDRPFVYLLIDCENNLPIFIGTVMDVK